MSTSPIPSRRELLSLPFKEWKTEKIYDEILLVPTRKKHDSGYTIMSIIGVTHNKETKTLEYEQAARCDDVCWKIPEIKFQGGYVAWNLRTDCYYPSGIIRFWHHSLKFKIGYSTSSTEVELITV